MAESPISPGQTIGGEAISVYEVTKIVIEVIRIVITLIKMMFEITEKFFKEK